MASARKRTAGARSVSEPRSECSDAPALKLCKRSSRVRTPSAKVLAQLAMEDGDGVRNGPKRAAEAASAALPLKKSGSCGSAYDTTAVVPPSASSAPFAAAGGASDINLTSTGSISQFLLGLDRLGDDGEEGSTNAVRRIASYATLHDAETGSIDGSGSDTDGGSYSLDSTGAAALETPLPKYAGGGGGRFDGLDAAHDASLDGDADGHGAKDKDKDGATSRKEWSAWEDEAIRNGVQTIGTRWRQIAAELPGRSDDAVRNRWARLQQSLSGNKLAAPPRVKRTDGAEQRQSWTEEEDSIISSSVREFGHRWNRIAERLPRRTEHAIRNRWHRIQMREFEELGIQLHQGAAPPSAPRLGTLTTAPELPGPAEGGAPSMMPHEAPPDDSTSSAPRSSRPSGSPPTPLPGRVTAPGAPAIPPVATLRPAPAGVARCDSLDVDGVTTAFYMDMPANFDVDDMLMAG